MSGVFSTESIVFMIVCCIIIFIPSGIILTKKTKFGEKNVNLVNNSKKKKENGEKENDKRKCYDDCYNCAS